MEAVFLEATQRLAPPMGPGLSIKQADALQHLAFDWILSADKYVDPRFQELAVYRDQVLAGACITSMPMCGLPKLITVATCWNQATPGFAGSG